MFVSLWRENIIKTYMRWMDKIISFFEGRPKETDDRTALIVMKDSLATNRQIVENRRVVKGRVYVSFDYRWYGGENADIINICLSRDRAEQLWSIALAELEKERKEQQEINEKLDSWISSFNPNTGSLFQHLKKTQKVT